MAFPAIGTGIGGFPLSECAAIMLAEVARHLQAPTSLERVYFVLFDAKARAAFENEMHGMVARGELDAGNADGGKMEGGADAGSPASPSHL